MNLYHQKSSLVILSLSLVLLLNSCRSDDSPLLYNPVTYELDLDDLPQAVLPADNPLTEAGVELGKMLFHDRRLSLDGSVSCASCHRQEDGFSDPRRFSRGIEGRRGTRQSMPIFNMALHNNGFFWDGRATTLREQALMPIEDPLEMGETLERVVAKLQDDGRYRDQFFRAFGEEGIDSDKMGLALEQFMFSIVSINSKYDQVQRGEASFTDAEERGRLVFVQSGCDHCHSGTNFENNQYLNNGLDASFEDEGRARVTNNPADAGKFKVPSLRNVALTAPYMHDGRFRTLEDVVEHYSSGIVSSSTLAPSLANHAQQGGLQLSNQQKEDLIDFLRALTDDDLPNNPAYSRGRP